MDLLKLCCRFCDLDFVHSNFKVIQYLRLTIAFKLVLSQSSQILLPLCNPAIPSLAVSCLPEYLSVTLCFCWDHMHLQKTGQVNLKCLKFSLMLLLTLLTTWIPLYVHTPYILAKQLICLHEFFRRKNSNGCPSPSLHSVGLFWPHVAPTSAFTHCQCAQIPNSSPCPHLSQRKCGLVILRK